ncbi:SRA-YDG [Imleria badia]|nr:SRA-YDG [Imleria badia]
MSQESRIFGPIPGVPVGTTFGSRKALLEAGVHGQMRAGIHGDPSENGGAFSICISGGYEDDEDFGDKITYVGSGGQDPITGMQIAHQSPDDPGNKSLQVSHETKRPVRVIRGKDEKNLHNWAPETGYRYDGLYVVDKYEMRQGKARYNMCFFELRRIREKGDSPVPYRNFLAKKMADMRRNAPKN